MNGFEPDFWLGSWHARWEGGLGTDGDTGRTPPRTGCPLLRMRIAGKQATMRAVCHTGRLDPAGEV